MLFANKYDNPRMLKGKMALPNGTGSIISFSKLSCHAEPVKLKLNSIDAALGIIPSRGSLLVVFEELKNPSLWVKYPPPYSRESNQSKCGKH